MESRFIHVIELVVLLVLLNSASSLAAKLSAGQTAPASAKGSGGAGLKVPFASAADVGIRRGQPSNPAPPAAPKAAASPARTQVDGVVREETEELKEVDGHLVRVVKGNFGYDSPEGLAVAVKYVADENGNRASFTIGSGKSSGGGGGGSGGGRKPPITPGGSSATSLGGGGKGTGGGRGGGGGGGSGGRTGSGAGGQGGAGTTKSDRTYLPPK